MPEILRYAAFTDRPAGGNPAGIVLDARGLDDAAMQTIAAEVGYSETAFVTGAADGALIVRYFTPKTEMPFCGHATIALGVALAERRGPGPLILNTQAGRVALETEQDGSGLRATLTSVAPYVDPVAEHDVAEALAALGWVPADLDEELPPRVAYAGARHLVLGVLSRTRLGELDYDVERLRTLAQARDWSTSHSCTAVTRPPSTRATPRPASASSRTRPPGPRPLRSAPTCGRSGSSSRRPRW